MDKDLNDPMGLNVANTPYTIKGNEQEGIFFSVYFKFLNEASLTNEKEVKEANKVIENMHLKLIITYNDGSVKERLIGFKNTSIYHYKFLDMYELTLPSEN